MMKDLEHDYFYDVEEDQKYCYPGTKVLRNKLRIKDFMRRIYSGSLLQLFALLPQNDHNNTSQRAPSNQRGREAPKNTWLLLDHMDSMKETDAERDDPNAESH